MVLVLVQHVDDALAVAPQPDLGDLLADLDRAFAQRAGAGPAGAHYPRGEPDHRSTRQ